MKRIAILAVALCLALDCTASAATGVVAFYNSMSNSIVIATAQGYTCGNVMSVHWNLSRGDAVVGELYSYGTHTLYDATIDDEISLWIEEFWIDQDQAIDWLQRQ